MSRGTVVTDPTDVPALAAALEDWADPARRRAAAVAGREIAAAFTIEKTVAQTIDALTRSAG
jgi:hypothetical protein